MVQRVRPGTSATRSRLPRSTIDTVWEFLWVKGWVEVQECFRSLCWKCCRDGARSTSNARGHGVVSQVAPGGSDRTQPADLDSAGRPRASIGACRSRSNADDRLPLASLGPVESGDRVVEGRDVADVRPQSSVTHPLDDLTQLGAIGHENKVDRQAVGGPRLGRPGDGHQPSSGSNQACGPLPDVAADDIENQIDSADVFEDV